MSETISADVTANISVIIPVYRAAATINRALASVAAQTVTPREVIIVDDGSDDGTFEIAQAWSSRLGKTKLIVLQEEHRGAGATRNKAVSKASCEFVAFLDADDEWLPQKLEKSLAVLNETKSEIVSHNYILVSGDRTSQVKCTDSYKKNDSALVGYFLRGYISTSTVVARRSTIIAAGGFDPELLSGQDYELWLAVLGLPDIRFHIFDEHLMRYHVVAGSISSKIELRRQCALAIAWRHAHKLHGYCRWPAFTLALRTIIIHIQAAIGFISQSRYTDALRVCCMTAVNFFIAFRKISYTPDPRPDFLQK